MVLDSQIDFKLDVLCRQLAEEPSTYVRFRHAIHDHGLLLNPEVYRNMLTIERAHAVTENEDEILINIRLGELITGFARHYPLTPIEFYRDIIDKTGLKPIFLGQLTPSSYLDKLVATFPNAKFVASRGARADFDAIRIAKNIVPAISTFSLAAAWLSTASKIFLQLNGFINPAHMREIRIIPIEDIRYRFFLFPLNYGLPEKEALSHHDTLKGRWREISRERVRFLQHQTPIMREGQEHRTINGFEEISYVHNHIDVAEDISNGWYNNGLHHYLSAGRELGYNTEKLGLRADYYKYPNLALGRKAWQSSICSSSRGRTPQDDAIRSVNGDNTKDFGFHTAMEHNPWWIVDCEFKFFIKYIVIFNRKGACFLQYRAFGLVVESSEDLHTWSSLGRLDEENLFKSDTHDMTPIIIEVQKRTLCRYIRISVPDRITMLHLSEVEVYGVPF